MKEYKAGYYLKGAHGIPPDPMTKEGQELLAVEQALQIIYRLKDSRYAAGKILDRVRDRLMGRLYGLVMDFMGTGND